MSSVTIDHPAARTAAPAMQPSLTRRLLDWAYLHRVSLCIAVPLLAAVGAVHFINMGRNPGWINDDEGTYMAQTWAFYMHHTLGHYTYWYDHPPLGWMTMATYAWLTNGFGRHTSTIALGREIMLVADVISGALLYVLTRRLNFSRVTASVVVALFAFSPLALHYHRMVFLDNLAVVWLLAAWVFAISPRQSVRSVFGASICFAAAVLTKETTAILLPVISWQLWQNSDKRMRFYNLGIFWAASIGVIFFYPLSALIKNEFFEGPGHVSLVWSAKWQIFERKGSGSVLNTQSDAYKLTQMWASIDQWVLILGIALSLPGLRIKRLGPVALAMFVQSGMLLRGGYLPDPYVIALLPFGALLIGCISETLIKGPGEAFRRASVNKGLQIAGIAVVAAVCIAFVGLGGASSWETKLGQQLTVDETAPNNQAIAWVESNISHDAVILTDDYYWPELVRAGYTNLVWDIKAQLDPAVVDKYLRNGYKGIDYVLLGTLSESSLHDMPTVAAAIDDSTVLASFGNRGDLTIRKVNKT